MEWLQVFPVVTYEKPGLPPVLIKLLSDRTLSVTIATMFSRPTTVIFLWTVGSPFFHLLVIISVLFSVIVPIFIIFFPIIIFFFVLFSWILKISSTRLFRKFRCPYWWSAVRVRPRSVLSFMLVHTSKTFLFLKFFTAGGASVFFSWRWFRPWAVLTRNTRRTEIKFQEIVSNVQRVTSKVYNNF